MPEQIGVEGEIIEIDPEGKYVLQCLEPYVLPGTKEYIGEEWHKFMTAPGGQLFILGGNFRLIKIEEGADEA